MRKDVNWDGVSDHMADKFHPHCITVPGAPAGFCDVIERWGTKSMAELLAPAMKLAEEGLKKIRTHTHTHTHTHTSA